MGFEQRGCREARMKEQVPYIVHEAAMARLERTIKRLWILCIVMFSAFVISNAIWIYYESQWETVTEQTVTQDNEGGNNSFVGGSVYGTPNSQNSN